jgi:hypothetical protein
MGCKMINKVIKEEGSLAKKLCIFIEELKKWLDES